MSTLDDYIDEIFGAFKDEYDNGQRRVSQEELDKQKQPPKENAMTVSSGRRTSGAIVRTQAIPPPVDSRTGRKLAEQEQITQWRIKQTAERTAMAVDSLKALGIYGFRSIDEAQNVIADDFYGGGRREGMNEFMKGVASRCLGFTEAGTLSILETYPKRIAGDL